MDDAALPELDEILERAIVVAIYVTGQGSRLNREAKIANIARTIYDGYQSGTVLANATY